MVDNSYWHYNILKRRDANGNAYYGLVEMFYENDIPTGWTKDDLLACEYDEGVATISKMLEMMLADAKKYPVLDEEGLKAQSHPMASLFGDAVTLEEAVQNEA